MDYGPGVPPESRSKIFERFYTADPSRAREKGGTGLGMAIAQSVVKAHHGFICATGTDDCVKLIDKQQNISCFCHFLNHFFDTLFKFSTVF